MRIRVRLIGHFITRFGYSEKELELDAPLTAGDLVSRLGMAGLPMVMARKGEGLPLAEPLSDGDRVVISPLFSGG